jgi:hypothetical protein
MGEGYVDADAKRMAISELDENRNEGASRTFEAPTEVLYELHSTRCGKGRDKAHVEATVALIKTMLEQGETEEVPSIEFLPEFVNPKHAKKGRKIGGGSGSRVGSGGAVQKV